jgi:hypothetical protein
MWVVSREAVVAWLQKLSHQQHRETKEKTESFSEYNGDQNWVLLPGYKLESDVYTGLLDQWSPKWGARGIPWGWGRK